MCGRYYIDSEERELHEIVAEAQRYINNEVKTGEIYPTNIAPVIRTGSNGTEVSAIKWGYPRWNGGGAVINARAETALEKNMFRKSLRERRCVVPSSGFYEWSRIAGKKQKDKYLITRPGSNALYMAGVWNTFKSPDGEYEAFVILTTSANEYMVPGGMELSLFSEKPRPIHDRMPVILNADERDAWLGSNGFMEDVLQRPGVDLNLTRVQTGT